MEKGKVKEQKREEEAEGGEEMGNCKRRDKDRKRKGKRMSKDKQRRVTV